MSYKVYEQKEVIEIFENKYKESLESIKGNSNYKSAMKIVERCLESKSAEPLRKHIDDDQSTPVDCLFSYLSSYLSSVFESAMKHDYSLSHVSRYLDEYKENGDIQDSLKSMMLFVRTYQFRDKLINDRLDVPYLIQKYCIENYSVFLQFPHRTMKDPDMVTFYRTLDDFIRGKVTVSKSGKWFMANNLGIEKEALEFSQAWTASAIKPPKVFFLSELKEKGGLSEENWKWVYGQTDSRTGSCMIKCSDIARVYADNEVLDIAFITSSDEPFKGKVIARSIVRHDNKTYIRAYQIDHKIGGYFVGHLREKGFREQRDLSNVLVKRIPHTDDRHLIMPYFDGEAQTAIGIKDNPNLLKVVRGSTVAQDKKSLRYLEVYHGTSGGYAELKKTCSHCSAISSPYDNGYIKGKDGKPVRINSCGYCRKNFLHCVVTNKKYSISDYKFVHLLSDYGNGVRVVDDENMLAKFKEVTCRITLNNIDRLDRILPSDMEDKEGNVIKDKKSFMFNDVVFASDPVTTIEGAITDIQYSTKLPDYLYNILTAEMKEKIGDYVCKYDREAKDCALASLSRSKAKRMFLSLLVKRKLITQEQMDAMTDSVKIPKLEVQLSDGASKMVRQYDEDEGEIQYVFNLSSEIREKLWKPILSETEKLKRELDELLASWNAVEVVMVNQ